MNLYENEVLTKETTIKDFIDSLENVTDLQNGHIKKLCDSLVLDNTKSNMTNEKKETLLNKWFVGCFSNDNMLFPILIGKGAIGKTFLFRNLLPNDYQKYLYAESFRHTNKSNDFIICFDDIMTGKGLKNTKANCIGNSNELDYAKKQKTDKTIIPIYLKEINQNLFNSIDKHLLWVEAFQLYKNGYDYKLK